GSPGGGESVRQRRVSGSYEKATLCMAPGVPARPKTIRCFPVQTPSRAYGIDAVPGASGIRCHAPGSVGWRAAPAQGASTSAHKESRAIFVLTPTLISAPVGGAIREFADPSAAGATSAETRGPFQALDTGRRSLAAGTQQRSDDEW